MTKQTTKRRKQPKGFLGSDNIMTFRVESRRARKRLCEKLEAMGDFIITVAKKIVTVVMIGVPQQLAQVIREMRDKGALAEFASCWTNKNTVMRT